MKQKLLLFIAMLCVTIASAQATHLNFDGVNDLVNLPISVSGTVSGSVEMWVQPTTLTATTLFQRQHDFVNTYTTIDIGLNLNAEVAENPVPGKVYFHLKNGAPNLSSTSILTAGQWYHIVVTWKSTSASLYINGVLERTLTGDYSGLASAGGTVNLGGYNSVRFKGNMDEIRVWNVARTAEEISANKNCELQGNEGGLTAYYKFNQGSDSANNAGITTLKDATSNANNGILTNFALTGATSNWLAGSPVITGSIIPSVATVTTPVTYNQGTTTTALTAAMGANASGLLWYTVATGGTATTTAPTPSTAIAGSTSYWVSSTNANGCESERTEIVVKVKENVAATHLNFDGVNDYVEIPKTFISDFTMEFWVKTTSIASSGSQWYNGKSLIDNEVAGVTTDFGTALVGNKLAFGIGFPDVTIFSTSNINDGNWNHVAVSWTQISGVMKLYINGVLESSGIGSTNTRIASNYLKIASNNYLGNFFNGNIDDVRIWNSARTTEQINASKNCELLGNEAGLVSYYKFNQGNDSANNSGITTLSDATSNANNATLTNFALAGATSNWLAGSPIITGVTCSTLSTKSFTKSNSIKVFPNPTRNNVTIEASTMENATIQVSDIAGRTLISKNISETSNTIDLSQLQQGVYIFKVKTKDGESVSKVVKQ